MNPTLASLLQTHFGFEQFRPGQEEAINHLLSGQNTLVVMPTGSGKSLIYQLAALQKPGLTLVISPLIALMKDQVDSLNRRKISATFINSAIDTSEQNKRLQNLTAGKYRIVYLAPERLRSLAFLKAVRQQPVQLLAVDEAHCISEWGHDFRPDYLRLGEARAALGNPLTAALTATATPKVQDDIIRLLRLPAQSARVVTGFNRSNLTFQVIYTSQPKAKLNALKELLIELKKGAAIIYTGTRRDAEEIADFIRAVIHLGSEFYHAGLDTNERNRIQDAFLSGKLSVVVATNAFGMGIDRADVRLIVHYNLPGSLEAYYQEVGRAGRDGQSARAVLLYAPDDRALQEWFIETSKTSYQDLKTVYQSLNILEDRQAWLTCQELSLRTGIQDVKLKVALSELERAGALEHLADEGLRMLIRCGRWDSAAIIEANQRGEQHLAHRKLQLNKMIKYAESNTCRRKILLAHFGDSSQAEASLCCDNCVKIPIVSPTPAAAPGSAPAGKAPQPQSVRPEPELITLVILDCVLRLTRPVGRTKIAQILNGSRAADIFELGYDKSTYYGRLIAFTQQTIIKKLDQLCDQGYLKVIGGKYPVLRLTPQGEEIIQVNRANTNKKTSHHTHSTPPETQDEIDTFLSHPHPRPLQGPWLAGWALGFHSAFTGKAWKRSQVGDLAYRLKYQGDLTAIPQLLDCATALIASHLELAQVDSVLPVPPSTPRPVDPACAFAGALAQRFSVKVLPAIKKTRQTEPQKQFHTLAQKRANVAGAFALQAPVRNLRLLLVDDLFDSGATLEEITRLLMNAGASGVYVLTLTRTIHSDA
jgi:ATP-dependent DNA helicase RecQ